MTTEQEAKRPLRDAARMAGQVGRGTAAAVNGTGRALWGPLLGACLILAGFGLGIGATGFFMEFYEFDQMDPERTKAEYVDQVQEDAGVFWALGALLVTLGVVLIAVDLYGKHVRAGMRLSAPDRHR